MLNNPKGQSPLEYTIIVTIVIIGIIFGGPYLIRSVNAHFRLWDEQVADSHNDPLIQGTVTGKSGGCTCDAWRDAGCGVDYCRATEMGQQRTCTPIGCDDEFRCTPQSGCCTNKTELYCALGKAPGCTAVGGTTTVSPDTCCMGARVSEKYCGIPNSTDVQVIYMCDSPTVWNHPANYCQPTCLGTVNPANSCLCPNAPTCTTTNNAYWAGFSGSVTRDGMTGQIGVDVTYVNNLNLCTTSPKCRVYCLPGYAVLGNSCAPVCLPTDPTQITQFILTQSPVPVGNQGCQLVNLKTTSKGYVTTPSGTTVVDNVFYINWVDFCVDDHSGEWPYIKSSGTFLGPVIPGMPYKIRADPGNQYPPAGTIINVTGEATIPQGIGFRRNDTGVLHISIYDPWGDAHGYYFTILDANDNEVFKVNYMPIDHYMDIVFLPLCPQPLNCNVTQFPGTIVRKSGVNDCNAWVSCAPGELLAGYCPRATSDKSHVTEGGRTMNSVWLWEGDGNCTDDWFTVDLYCLPCPCAGDKCDFPNDTGTQTGLNNYTGQQDTGITCQ